MRTFQIIFYPGRCYGFWDNDGSALDGPADEELCGFFSEIFCEGDYGLVVNGSARGLSDGNVSYVEIGLTAVGCKCCSQGGCKRRLRYPIEVNGSRFAVFSPQSLLYPGTT